MTGNDRGSVGGGGAGGVAAYSCQAFRSARREFKSC